MIREAMAVGVCLFIVDGASAQTPVGTAGDPPRTATARLMDTEGRPVGDATLQQTPHGVLVKLDLKNAAPGIHALHLHDTGRCDNPTFESAGGHFNPAKRQHGFINPQGHHAGDLPNIDVPASKQIALEYLVPGVTLDPGPLSLLDANGSAIVIHAGKDDHASDPAGNAGDRVACGPIARDNR